jgi:1-pyrroline-5-carboxylate dehydrogenase
LSDFFRFGVKFVEELYVPAAAIKKCAWLLEVRARALAVTFSTTIYRIRSRVEYRALEGFVLAVSSFNFTAIGGHLPGGEISTRRPTPTTLITKFS